MSGCVEHGKCEICEEVIAPYRDEQGNAKDWIEKNGKKIRMTHPSNLVYARS